MNKFWSSLFNNKPVTTSNASDSILPGTNGSIITTSSVNQSTSNSIQISGQQLTMGNNNAYWSYDAGGQGSGQAGSIYIPNIQEFKEEYERTLLDSHEITQKIMKDVPPFTTVWTDYTYFTTLTKHIDKVIKEQLFAAKLEDIINED